MRRPEQALQISLMQWLEAVLPHDAFVFAIPNSARRGVVEGVMMKRMGTKKGMPDLCVLYRGAALFMELKAGKGRVQTSQKWRWEDLGRAGCYVALVRSISDAEAALRSWNVPLKIKGVTTHPSKEKGVERGNT